MSVLALGVVALFAAVPICLLLAHLFIAVLRKLAAKKTAPPQISRPKLWARSAHGGENSVKALLALSGEPK